LTALTAPYSEGLLVEIVDLALGTGLVLVLLVWLKDARGRLAFAGVAVVGVAYALSLQAGLILTARLLQATFLVSAVMLLLVFQEDLRRRFERVAAVVLRRRSPAPADMLDTLVRAAFSLAGSRHGALLVIPGRDPIELHVEGGILLDGLVTESLLLSLFDPHSPGHDGAVVVEADRVARFAVHLPLSTRFEELGTHGTRHAAALGVTERCDAACVVVSEERGEVSLAVGGRMQRVHTPVDLEARLRELPGVSRTPTPPRHAVRGLVRSYGLRLSIALPIALLLWALVVPGSQAVTRTFLVPVEVENLPPGYVLEDVSPESLQVTVSGPRRTLFFLEPEALVARLDAFLVRLGRRSFEVSPHSISHPDSLEVREVNPGRVLLTVRPPKR
jgi:diadenylate cyclase